MEKNIIIRITSGLHARPAAKLTVFAKNYSQQITLIKGEKSAPMQSLIRVLGLGIVQGDSICISVEGDHAEQVLNELAVFLEKLADEE